VIITEQKQYKDILKSLEGAEKIYIVGCGRCATSCETGGEKQVKEVAVKLKKDGKTVTGKYVVEAPCDERLVMKFSRDEKEKIKKSQAVLVLGCGAGVQAVADAVKIPAYPALESLFLGKTKRMGEFYELCTMCGSCVLSDTGGICPVSRCSKHLLNGPCGGSHDGKCEVDPNLDCAWYLIFKRLEETGQLVKMEKFMGPKDYSAIIRPRKVETRKKK
jgi:ferredoxin